MSGESFRGILESWADSQVTVVNPESFKSTALGQGLSFQSYAAQLSEIGADYIKLSFSAVKKDAQTEVEQIIPIAFIKRVSLWGGEKLIHL
ncbi:MAG: hypothetical protein JSW50_09605 [Candidatus Latescibacterota bacterium]|nr:MAG: hypothetical protein JSW50_09605 [Candidatus Latescibacterota bacterium]